MSGETPTNYSLVELPTIAEVCEFIHRGDTPDDQVRKIIEQETSQENIKNLLDYHSTVKIVSHSKILYRIPDSPLLNEFSWQAEDMLPHFPRIRKFLDYWIKNIDGPLKSVRIAYSKNLERSAFGNKKYEKRIH